MTTDRLDITCSHGEKTVFVTRIDRSADDDGLRWLHDQDAPWGGGGTYAAASGSWEWYDREQRAGKVETRSHTTSEHLLLICHLCPERLVVGTAKWQKACDLIAPNVDPTQPSVSIAEFRAVAHKLH
jgi:hypothetical protein